LLIDNAGSFTSLGTYSVTLVITDVLYISAVGSSITAKLNGTTRVGPVTNATLTTGKAGLFIYGNNQAFDDWAGGDFSTTKTFAADAVLSLRTTKTFGADAILTGGATFTQTFNADAVLSLRTTKAFNADAVLQLRTTKEFAADAVLSLRTTQTFGADAVLQLRTTKTFGADAVISLRTTKTFGADAVIVSRTENTFGADAVLSLRSTQTFNADAVLALRATKTFNADAILSLRTTKTFGADAVLALRATKTFNADAVLALRAEKTFGADAILSLRATKAFNADAVLALRAEKTFGADAVLALRTEKTFGADAVLALRAEKTFGADAKLVNQYTKTFGADAEIVAIPPSGPVIEPPQGNALTILRPGGMISPENWTKVGAATNWQALDEVTANNFTDYVEHAVSGGLQTKTDTYSMTDPSPLSYGTIGLVYVWAVAGYSLSGDTAEVSVAVVNPGTGTSYFGTAINTPAFSVAVKSMTTRPWDSSKWTWLDIENLRTALRSFIDATILDGTNVATQVGAAVYYTAAIRQADLTFGADAIIESGAVSTYTKTFGADAVLSLRTTKTFGADAIVINNKTFGADAVLIRGEDLEPNMFVFDPRSRIPSVRSAKG
jgi:hypothetical protein